MLAYAHRPCPNPTSTANADAFAFVAMLHRRFEDERQTLLHRRHQQQALFDAGQLPDFLPETLHIRNSPWRVAPIPADLRDRRVEITGPVDRKMVINALNSGAKCFMADFEDSHCPTWEATLAGHQNLADAIRGTITLDTPDGKHYTLNPNSAVLIARPRGWHLDEAHMQVDGRSVSGSLFDFGLYCFNNAHALRAKGTGIYLYLPKLQHYLEARLWAEVFALTESALNLPKGTIRCTVLIETLPAAFQLHEILFELKDYIVALNCGRWDYIFSTIKTRRKDHKFNLPDRSQITMATHAMQSYSQLVIQTCHRRGAMAMGGMAALIPVKGDETANAKALAAVKADKEREATNGHDGTWVAHPALVPIAMEVFDRLMPTPNQLHVRREELTITRHDLLTLPQGSITLAGVQNNITVAIRYTAAWLDGLGCVPIFNLMEDAATAEISRTQLWLWINRSNSRLDDGTAITAPWLEAQFDAEAAALAASPPAGYHADTLIKASALLKSMIFARECGEFLTLPAYRQLVQK